MSKWNFRVNSYDQFQSLHKKNEMTFSILPVINYTYLGNTRGFTNHIILISWLNFGVEFWLTIDD